MAGSDQSSILLTRSNNWTNRFRKFKVEIDGNKLGTIANAQCERYSLAPGRHRIQVKVDWYKSRPLELELSEGEEVHLECGTKEGVVASLGAVVSPGNYLYLNTATSPPPGTQGGIWRRVTALTDQLDTQHTPVETGAQESPAARMQLFISYRRGDSPDVCGRIYDRLIQIYGKSGVFKDVDSIPFGVDFREHLDQMVSRCDVLLAVIGDRWLDSQGPEGKSRLFEARDYVRIEIESALQRNIPVIPLLVRGAQLPVESALPDSIKHLVYRNGLQIRPDPDFHNDMDRLIEGLSARQ